MPSSPSEPIWLDAAFAIKLNAAQVAISDEPHHVRDVGLLESALAAPSNLYSYEGQNDILTLGIRLMHSVAQNHPFVQGNKRTAFHLGNAFIERNGLFVELPDMETVADKFLLLVTGKEAERDFRAFMRPYVLDPAIARKFWKK